MKNVKYFMIPPPPWNADNMKKNILLWLHICENIP
jgi:hypothetical protein